MFHKHVEELKNKQPAMNTSIIEAEKNKEKIMKRNEDSHRDLLNIKCTNIQRRGPRRRQ